MPLLPLPSGPLRLPEAGAGAVAELPVKPPEEEAAPDSFTEAEIEEESLVLNEPPADFTDKNAPSADLKSLSSSDPLISIDDASREIGAETLRVLKARFNGKLSDVRYCDDHDHLI